MEARDISNPSDPLLFLLLLLQNNQLILLHPYAKAASYLDVHPAYVKT